MTVGNPQDPALVALYSKNQVTDGRSLNIIQEKTKGGYLTFGGLPRFFFGASGFNAARLATDPFLFLLPLGRPRFRFGDTPSVSGPAKR
jgi:hypothetical protein